MTRDEFAAMLNGREYRKEMTKAEEAQAKAAGLLVIFGASDDLLEFRGAFSDEIGAYEGTTARVTSSGVLPAWEDMDKDEERDVELYFALKRHAREVKAEWDKDGFSWVITADLPHATFVIMDEAEPYCRGAVLSIADLAPIAGPSLEEQEQLRACNPSGANEERRDPPRFNIVPGMDALEGCLLLLALRSAE